MKPDFFSISMFPTKYLENEYTLKSLLNILEKSNRYVPTHWGNDERVKLDYNSEDIIQKIIVERKVSELHLNRNKATKFNLMSSVFSDLRAFFNLECKTLSSKAYTEFLDLSDQLASVLQPTFGTTHIFWPASYPWTNDQERLHVWMDACALPTPVNFFKNGPLGIGARTYFSGEILDMIGKEFLFNSPGKLKELEWGGVRLDIVEDPFNADLATLLDSWLQIMNYMRELNVFANYEFDSDQMGVTFSPSSRWSKKIKS